MREIKFRAWMAGLKTMIDCTGDYAITFDGSDDALITLWASDGVVDEFTSSKVMQFTEIHDCYGVEIYFGDIVKIYGYGNLHVDSLGDLMILVDALAENDIGEILGNIYENKDLIEADK